MELPGLDAPELECWRWLRQRAIFGKSGRRISMCVASSRASLWVHSDNAPVCPINEFGRTFACLEMDLLGAKKLGPLVIKGDAADGATNGERSGSTTSGRPTVDEAAVRSCAQNAVVISQLMLNSRANERYCLLLRSVGQVLKQWHTSQNRKLRSSDGARQWVVDEVSGGYMRHITDFLGILSNIDSLQEGMFAMTAADASALALDLIAEDEFAEFLGQACVGMATFRMRRNLTLIAGWPKKLFKLLGDAGGLGLVPARRRTCRLNVHERVFADDQWCPLAPQRPGPRGRRRGHGDERHRGGVGWGGGGGGGPVGRARAAEKVILSGSATPGLLGAGSGRAIWMRAAGAS